MIEIQGSYLNPKYVAYVSKTIATQNGKFFFNVIFPGVNPGRNTDSKFEDHKLSFFFDSAADSDAQRIKLLHAAN